MGRKRKLENVPRNDAKVRKISEFMSVSQSNSVADDTIVNTEFRDEVPEKQSETLSQIPKSTPNREFRDDWKHNRPWLIYNPQTRNMYCSVCQSANVANSLTIGCAILKKENVTNHEKAKGKNGHAVALNIVQASKDYNKSVEALLSKSESAVTATISPNMLISDFNEHYIDQGCSSLKSLKVEKHTCTSYEH